MNEPTKAQLRKELSEANETLADIQPLFEAFNDASEEAIRKFDHMPITFTEWIASYVQQHEAMKREITRLKRIAEMEDEEPPVVADWKPEEIQKLNDKLQKRAYEDD